MSYNICRCNAQFTECITLFFNSTFTNRMLELYEILYYTGILVIWYCTFSLSNINFVMYT